MAGCVSALLMLALSASAQAEGAGGAPWWNRDWPCRVRVQLPSLVAAEAVSVWVDFAAVLKELELPADQLDANSIRVVEADGQGDGMKQIPSLFEERLGKTAGWGWVTWRRGKGRRYDIYLDTVGHGSKAPPKQELPKLLLANSVNIVPNPGFEEAWAYYQNRLPTNWRFSARDAATKTMKGDLDFLSLGYALSEERVRSGRKSMKFSLGAASGKWDVIYFKNPIPAARIPPLQGRRIHARVFAWLESGSGIPPLLIQDSGEKGWIKNITACPAEKTGEWFPIVTTGVIDENTVRLQLTVKGPILNDALLFYLDDFNVQAEVSDLLDVSLDKAEYFLSDEKAHVALKLNVDRECLLPVPATAQTLNGATGEVNMGFRGVPGESLLENRTFRLAVVENGRHVATREAPACKESSVALDIANLKAGNYTVLVELPDEDGKPLLCVSKPFSRLAGPFD